MGRRLGLIIGINQYQDPAFWSLRYPEIDAKAIGQWLVNARGGKWNPADVQVLLGSQATRNTVEAVLAQMCIHMAGPDDTVVVYFAGHGFLDEARGEGYLALADTRYQAPVTGLHLPTLISQAMGRSRAGQMVFILDYFQTGRIWSLRRTTPYDSRPLLGPTLLNALQQVDNRILLCSCRGNESAPESSEQNLGQLAYRMILGLCGPASDPATGQVTLQRLSVHLMNTLDEQHRPQIFGQASGPVVLVGEMPPASSPFTPRGVTPMPGFFGDVPSQQPQALYAGAAVAQMSPQQAALRSGSQVEQQALMLLQQARSMIQMQKVAEAMALIEQALHLAPTNSAALILKGQLLGTLGHFPEALQVVEQLLQMEPNNALGWSMRAALQANMGQFEEALQSVERSLALEPNNMETQTIKSTILLKLAIAQTPGTVQARQPVSEPLPPQGGPRTFFLWLALHMLGLLLGIAGIALAVKMATLPPPVPVALEGLGLALLCVNAARGAYRYGASRFLATVVIGVVILAVLGYTFATRSGQTRFVQFVKAHPQAFTAINFFSLWLALAAVIPLLVALVALLVGIMRGVRKRGRGRAR